MNVRSDEQSRVDIYTQMQYKNIRFEKSNGGFKASYTLTAVIRNSKGEIIQSKEVDCPIETRTYEETVSPRFDSRLQSIVLPPSDYSLEITAVDNLSHLRFSHVEKLSAKNYSDSSTIASGILFLNTMVHDEKGITIRPILPSSISLLSDSIGIFQELYNIGANDTIHIAEIYRTPRNSFNEDRSFNYLMPPYKTPLAKCENRSDSVYLMKDSLFIASQSGTLQTFQFYPLPSVGGTTIERTISVRNNTKRDSLSFIKNVFRRDKRFLNALSSEEILSAMRYILMEREYDSLAGAVGQDQMVKINSFWDHRGGVERRTEFERKIAEANMLFTSCVDGSRTAMGIVYIVCGTPDYIDCRGSFIETWLYNIGERAYPIEFRRENEQTVSFEIAPFSINDIVWQYFIDRWRRK